MRQNGIASPKIRELSHPLPIPQPLPPPPPAMLRSGNPAAGTIFSEVGGGERNGEEEGVKSLCFEKYCEPSRVEMGFFEWKVIAAHSINEHYRMKSQ